MPKALRRPDADPASASLAKTKPAPALTGALDGAAPQASPPLELQDRLAREFAAPVAAQTDPEPFVEPWSPATQMLIVLGGGLLLWASLAAAARLVLH